VTKIEELAANAPRSREELAARLHALARLDLRDAPDTPAETPLPFREGPAPGGGVR
jgi:hypothetical protein